MIIAAKEADWWARLSKEQQENYINRHPRSKKAVEAKEARQKTKKIAGIAYKIIKEERLKAAYTKIKNWASKKIDEIKSKSAKMLAKTDDPEKKSKIKNWVLNKLSAIKDKVSELSKKIKNNITLKTRKQVNSWAVKPNSKSRPIPDKNSDEEQQELEKDSDNEDNETNDEIKKENTEELVDSVSKKVDEKLEENPEYKGLPGKIRKYASDPKNMFLLKAAVVTVTAVAAGALIVAMPGAADLIIQSAAGVADLAVTSTQAAFGVIRKGEYGDDDEDDDEDKKKRNTDGEVDLLPAEKDQAYQRKIEMQKIGLDENGNTVEEAKKSTTDNSLETEPDTDQNSEGAKRKHKKSKKQIEETVSSSQDFNLTKEIVKLFIQKIEEQTNGSKRRSSEKNQ